MRDFEAGFEYSLRCERFWKDVEKVKRIYRCERRLAFSYLCFARTPFPSKLQGLLEAFSTGDPDAMKSRGSSSTLILIIVSLLLAIPAIALDDAVINQVTNLFSTNTTGQHTNNWAVLVCSSRYWFNYRVSPSIPRSRHLSLYFLLPSFHPAS